MSRQNGHTQTPWHSREIDDEEAAFRGYGGYLISDGKFIIAYLPFPSSAPDGGYGHEGPNAEFIVRAVNAHDDMKAALKLALEYWNHRLRRYKTRRPQWVKDAEAALAKARNQIASPVSSPSPSGEARDGGSQ